MADVSVTAANVLASSTASKRTGTAGATITAGQAVYLDTTTQTWKLAQSDGTSAEAGSAGIGIALHGASSGQPLTIATNDVSYTVGGTVTQGEVYVVSATAGGIAPESDLASTNKVTVLGVGLASNKLYLAPIVSGAVVP